MRLLNNITPMEEDFAKWYQDVVVKGNLIAYSNIKGAMIFKPIAYGIWNQIQLTLNNLFNEEQIENVYLPLLIPRSYIEKEKKHIEGFAPELATITHVGDKKLDQPYVIRPTSEVLFGELFAKEVRSYNDLPIYYNQWANVVRWEKTTNPFLRNREFLWQEGHTVHSNQEEAEKFALKMIYLYAKFVEDYLALPVIVGQKSENEKFSGAKITYTIEAMMKDGKALQVGTSHYLGENFAKPFNVTFKNRKNTIEYVKQTSWGISTRLIGAIIMSHGDNRGIVIPPKIATYQIDIIDFLGTKNENVRETAKQIYEKLKTKWRVRKDFSAKNIGYKVSKSEIEGTPLRIEIGPRDLLKNLVIIVRRDTGEKINVSLEDLESQVPKILTKIHDNLLAKARNHLLKNIVEVNSYEEFKKQITNKKFVLVPFAGETKEEIRIKEETLATTRCIPFKQPTKKAKCIITNQETSRYVIFARAY